MNELIHINNLRKTYDGKRYILDGLDFTLNQGEICTILGASGCGKSTFLNIIGLLDSHNGGEYYFNNVLMNPQKLNSYYKQRALDIGFVFQAYCLIDSLSVTDNILMPFLYNGRQITGDIKENIDSLLHKFDMFELKNKKASILSGGERQRVAIIRAIIKKPKLIIADEPTGNLDAINAEIVTAAFKEIVESGTSIIVVTHNEHLSFGVGKTFTLRGGKLYT